MIGKFLSCPKDLFYFISFAFLTDVHKFPVGLFSEIASQIFFKQKLIHDVSVSFHWEVGSNSHCLSAHRACCLPGSLGPKPRLFQLELLICASLHYSVFGLSWALSKLFLPFSFLQVKDKKMWIERSFDFYYPRTAVTISKQKSQHCS